MENIVTREIELRYDSEERTVEGIAVPFGQEINAGGYKERFAIGSVPEDVTDVKLFYGHEEPIGKVVEGRNTPDGFIIKAKISDTPRGNEIHTLLKDGVLNKFSVGFIPVEQEKDGSTVVRTLVNLLEVSVVAFPAYSGAAISQVRETQEELVITHESHINEENISMENIENIELDVREMKEELAVLNRKVEDFSAPALVTNAPQFRSQGEYAKALAKGDESAKELFRAATTGDSIVYPGWLGMINNLVDNGRPTVSAFSQAALPASGMTVEYGKVSANTIAVDEQALQNDALDVGYIELSTVSADVKTYGGYTDMSRQTIERSSVPYLDTAFRAMSLEYAKRMNTVAKNTVTGLSYVGKTFDASGGTYADVAGAIADGAAYMAELTGFSPEFIIVSPDAYKWFVQLEGADGRPVLNVAGPGVNNIGGANVAGLNGSIFGLRLVVDFSYGAGSAYLANSNAIQTLESAGAPVRLQDEDITTLTNTFSVYGYAAITVPFADAIVKLDITP